jgi:hypothetical protein
MQGHGALPGAARPAAQCDLLGHGAGGEEGGGLHTQGAGSVPLQFPDDAVAVHVDPVVRAIRNSLGAVRRIKSQESSGD